MTPAQLKKKLETLTHAFLFMEDEKENINYEESFDEFSYRIIAERISKYNFPVIFGFPNGHIYDNRPIIIGAEISMKVGNKVEVKF